MNKTSLLELAKKLNIPHRKLEEAVKDTITKYKEIIFGPGSPKCIACLDEFQNQNFEVIDEKMYDQKLMDDMIRQLAWDKLQKML